ncbi:MAG: MaoC family dehydratase N-terminal domain-containing protein [Proteobacteria bacterium]|nr:MaoC family dehydratase N-terminal domain-containing protein [Pseudomonadota bacterium]
MTDKSRYYEDVKENDSLPAFDITVTRTHIIKYAGAGGDFQPIHHDEEYARAVGLPSIFAMGMMHGGMLARLVTDWAGVGRVKRYRLRFGTMVWPGDTLTFQGIVARKEAESGENLVDLSLSVTNQKGESAIIGEATVALPSRV